MIKLAIDPGHGMSNRKTGLLDMGAESHGIFEANIALSWALTLKHTALARGVEAWLTRGDNLDPAPVGTRDDRAKAAGCTHFLSIHCNAGGGHGTETFYRDAADKEFAGIAQKCALASLGLRDRGLKTESASQHSRLAVFDFPGPCALLELGFIDNATDRARMQEKGRRIRFAELLVGELLGAGK